jgi:acyl-coenzyme A synthetase/AMP-(fatty) acid ligase
MSGFTALRELRPASRAEATPVAYCNGSEVSWRQLLADVAAAQRPLEEAQVQRWALYCDESYPFTVALLAVLGLGHTAYLPATNTPGVAAQLAAQLAARIGDWPDDALAVATGSDCRQMPALPARGELVIFTSGSTGAPQAIRKNLRQLDSELATHEALWGAQLDAAQILATVSHQHIYGLLFKVLGPLCAGRVSHSALYRDPANLLEAAAALPRAAWIASPAHLQRLDAAWPWAAARERLAAVFCSGGPLDGAAANHCRELSGLWPTEVYGSSESGGVAFRQQAGGDRAWRLLPAVEARGSADGALELRSPHLPDAAWFTTADAVTFEADGRFQLRGRLDRIVKIEGKRLALPELEQLLRGHPWIDDCRALVVQRRRRRVAVVAALSAAGADALARRGRRAALDSLGQYLARHFEPIVLPRLWRFVPALPFDRQGKIPQRALQDLFAPPAPATLPQLLGAITTATGCQLRLRVPADLACLPGHFPGAPVVPGVVLIGWAEHFGRSHLNLRAPLRGLENIKFKQPVPPGAELVLELAYEPGRARLSFSVRSPAGEHAAGRLLLGPAADGADV